MLRDRLIKRIIQSIYAKQPIKIIVGRRLGRTERLQRQYINHCLVKRLPRLLRTLAQRLIDCRRNIADGVLDIRHAYSVYTAYTKVNLGSDALHGRNRRFGLRPNIDRVRTVEARHIELAPGVAGGLNSPFVGQIAQRSSADVLPNLLNRHM